MTALVLIALLAAQEATAVTAPARIVNARVETRTAPAGLAGIVREISVPPRGPLWIGYVVDSNQRGTMCCFGSLRNVGRCSGCRLEGGGVFFTDERSPARQAPVELEGSREVLILYRLAEGRVERVQAFSAECPLDAGGLPFVWLTDVAPAESLALLRTFVDAHDDVLAAIAAHADPAADQVLIEVARRATSGDRRGQALFWLAQKASRKAVGEIQRAILEDPETEVKKQAVSALSDLPSGEGVPILIELARRHKNPVVREQAFFWLGESEDARAVAFFAEVLGR